ncbi:pectinesterase inhibitor-like [Impatiens glandulifera]|uniref:pectinesterase inhibitor-like n=1 Tax=Impatiens glandulifera TaxID=253017 RepID=UPI001FB15DEF|nr:pectinesterase inhibitor-like [Impatiens glandulifera]
MALSHSLNLHSFLLSLLVLFTLSFAFSDIKANTLVSQICADTRNPSLCNQVLDSDPGASTADLKGLGYISIKIALTNVKQTLPYIKSLVMQTTDVMLKNRYKTCAENYSNTVDSLNQSKTFLDKGDIPSLRTYASAAFDGPGTCEDSFEGPPAAPAKLNDANKKLEDHVSILLKIGALLGGDNSL